MKVRTSALRGFALVALSALAFSACEDKEAPVPVIPVTVQVLPSSANMTVGQSQGFTAIVSNTDNTAVTWSSSTPAVASVSATGTVQALSAGTTNITATSVADGSKTGVAVVTVVAAPAPTIQLIPPSATVSVNGTLQLIVLVTNSAGTTTFTSSNAAVASVSASGLVTALTVGTTTITAQNGTAIATSQITVVAGTPPPTVTVTITPTSPTIADNGTVQFTATVTNATNTAVTWSSSNTAVATISDGGLATGQSPGVTTITATSDQDPSKSVSTQLTVTPVVAPSISIQSVRTQPPGGAPGINVAVGSTVGGNLVVTMNVTAGTQTDINRVEVRLSRRTGLGPPETFSAPVTGCVQTFNPPLAPTQGVAQIQCVLNTAQLTEPGNLALFTNGVYKLDAAAFAQGITEPVATATYGNLNLQNTNVVTGQVTFDNTRNDTDNDPANDRVISGATVWRGGTATLMVQTGVFTGTAITSLTVSVDVACDGALESSQTQTITNGSGTFVFSEQDAATGINTFLDGVENPVVCFAITGGSATDSEGLIVPLTPTSGNGAVFSSGNTQVATEGATQNVFAIDNVPPVIAAGFDIPASVIANNRYGGNNTTFALSTLQNATATDGGVDAASAASITRTLYWVNASATVGTQAQMAAATDGIAPLSATNRPPSSGTLNNAFRLILKAMDRLGNVSYAASSTFGMDTDNPILSIRPSPPNLATMAADGSVNTDLDIHLAVADVHSGPEALRVRAANFSVLEVNGNATVEARCLTAPGVLGAVPATGGTFAPGTPVSIPAACTAFLITTTDVGGQTEPGDIIHPDAADANEGYFRYEVQGVDRAGNFSDLTLFFTTLNDVNSPTGDIQIITINRVLNTIRLQGEIEENVDLAHFDTRLVFPGLANVPDEIPFNTPTPVSSYGLQGLVGIRTDVDITSGAVFDITDQTGTTIVPNQFGFGMTDVAQNFAFTGEPITTTAGAGAGIAPAAFDASFVAREGDAGAVPPATDAFTLDRSAGPNSVNTFAQITVGPTDQNPITEVLFFIVHPGNDGLINTADDYNQLLVRKTTHDILFTGETDRTFTYTTSISSTVVPRDVDNPNQTYGVFAVAVRGSTGSAVMSDVILLTIQD